MKRGNIRRTGFGTLALTNKRFLFLQKPNGFYSKGDHIRIVFSLGDIMSVTITGLLVKRLTVQIKDTDANKSYSFSCSSNTETKRFAKKLVRAKDEFKNKKARDAKTFILDERDKDRAEGQ